MCHVPPSPFPSGASKVGCTWNETLEIPIEVKDDDGKDSEVTFEVLGAKDSLQYGNGIVKLDDVEDWDSEGATHTVAMQIALTQSFGFTHQRSAGYAQGRVTHLHFVHSYPYTHEHASDDEPDGSPSSHVQDSAHHVGSFRWHG